MENFDSSMKCIKPSRKSQTGNVAKKDSNDRSSYQLPAAVGIGGLAEVSEDQEEQKFSKDSQDEEPEPQSAEWKQSSYGYDT